MYPRRDTVEIFSTFLRLEGDRAGGWETDARLRRSIARSLAHIADTREVKEAQISIRFLTIYWHQVWQTATESEAARLAIAHISAYLQEACYWASRKMRSRFFHQTYQVADYFQIAIAIVPKILKSYDPERCTRLEDYARVAFQSVIQDALRLSREVDLCNDWSLLRKLSKRRFREVLREAGLNEEERARYQLAWTCFQTLYQPPSRQGTRSLEAPRPETLAAIAKAYNRDRVAFLGTTTPPVTPETLETWLLKCAHLARSSFYPFQNSLNQPHSDSDPRELLDTLTAVANPTLLETWIECEEREVRSQQQAALNRFLLETISTLEPKRQEILQLYYRQGLIQQQIAQKLGMQQYQVSRQLTRARELLLRAIATWSQQTLNVKLSAARLSAASATLEEWLQGDYARSPEESKL